MLLAAGAGNVPAPGQVMDSRHVSHDSGVRMCMHGGPTLEFDAGSL